jgi:hypothetical protein
MTTTTTTTTTELGPLGHALVLRQLGDGDAAQALIGLLATAYRALVDGDVDGATAVLGAVIAPALAQAQAIAAVQRAQTDAATAAAHLARVAPTAITADAGADGPQLAAWAEALEDSVAAQMELLARITALTAAPPVGVEA